jgi:tetratricopeptide (TPR) repeat protein
VERVLLKALAKERDDRYPDALAMAAAFREAVAGAAAEVMALPHVVPVSPNAPTPSPSGVTLKGEAPGAATVLSPTTPPPAGAPPPAQENQKKRGYKFAWWHALVGFLAVGCLCFGFLVLANAGQRRAAQQTSVAANATATALARVANVTAPAPTNTPPSPATHAPPAPVLNDVRGLLAQADTAYRENRHKEALEFLTQAIALNPADLNTYLIAGDMTLAGGLTMDALVLFYIPGVDQAQSQTSTEPTAQALRGHAALAFYMLAAEPGPGAGDFLKLQIDTYPDKIAPRLGLIRFNVFHDHPDAALADLQGLLNEDPGNPGASLIFGDYHLKAGQPVEAAARYKAAQEVNQPAPPWVRVEAACGARKVLNQRANARLEPTCEPLSSLLTGK